jgi:hypothetical protein
MDQLKITLFPSGPGAYLASTYDEKTANPYPMLPDPLTFNDGSKVNPPANGGSAARNCRTVRSRSLRTPAKEYAQGYWTVASTTEGKTGNVDVISKQLVGRVDNSAYPELNVTILATLSTPKNATGPVPVVLMFGGGGAAPRCSDNDSVHCARSRCGSRRRGASSAGSRRRCGAECWRRGGAPP